MHHTSPSFWKFYDELSEEIQTQADENFELLKKNPTHPSLHFKKIGKYWSVRASLEYRALGTDIEDGILWFWIGIHSEYERLIYRQKKKRKRITLKIPIKGQTAQTSSMTKIRATKVEIIFPRKAK